MPVIADGKSLTVSGTITATTFNVNSTGSYTDLLVGAGGTATLNGGGHVALSDSAFNRIYSNTAGSVLENIDTTIAGAGQILSNGGSLTVKNDAGGTILACGGASLTVSSFGSLVNNGVLRDTGAGGLLLASDDISGTGMIEANGAGSHVDFTNVTLHGGVVRSTLGGTINTSGSFALDGSTAAGSVVLDTTSTLNVTAISGSLFLSNDAGFFTNASAYTLSSGSQFVKNGGSGISVINSVGQSFVDNGLIKVTSGTLKFTGTAGTATAELTGTGLITGDIAVDGSNNLAITATGLAGPGGIHTFHTYHTDLTLASTDVVAADGSHTYTSNSGSNTIYGTGGNDFLTAGSGNDVLYGLGGADTLTGGTGTGFDWLRGGAGDDRVVGGHGTGVLQGGAGNDTFVFNIGDAGGGLTTVADFAQVAGNHDHVELHGFAAGASFASGTATPFDSATPSLFYRTDFGGLFWDPGAGQTGYVEIARFTNLPVLTLADIAFS